jgi:Tfp pilus assembly protein PilE
VTVIIGILATIVLVAYNGVQARAKDTAVLSDLDTMDSIQTNYGIKNNTAGKAYYSGDGADSELGFTAANGDVIDVVVNATDYCIRGYNPNGTKNSIFNAYTKESTAGICNLLPPSAKANPPLPAYLSNLMLQGLPSSSTVLFTFPSSGFDKNAYTYTANLQYDDSSISVTPTAEDSGAIITVNGSTVASGQTSTAIGMNVGVNTVIIRASSGSRVSNYTVALTRASNPYLLSIAVKAGIKMLSPTPAFVKNNYEYRSMTTGSIVTMQPIAEGGGTITITANGTSFGVASGAWSQNITVNIGTNDVTVVCNSATGSDSRSYHYVLTR